MADNNGNTALKKSFLAEVLSDEILETLDKESKQDDVLLFEALVDEVEGDKNKASALKKKQNEKADILEDPLKEQEKSRKKIFEDKTSVLGGLSEVESVEVKETKFKRSAAIDLKNADYIKFAQEKIKRLESELSGLRSECEELALAGDHFKVLAEEKAQTVRALEAKIDEIQNFASDEKNILDRALSSKDVKISALEERVVSLEEELEAKYNRVRVRERELESRLEILKQEQAAVSSSKDEMILRLRKQNSSLDSDLAKIQGQKQKVLQSLQEKEDSLKRTVKALKLSLTMLENQND